MKEPPSYLANRKVRNDRNRQRNDSVQSRRDISKQKLEVETASIAKKYPQNRLDELYNDLHNEIVAFASHVEPTAAELQARHYVFRKIEQTIKSQFYDAEVNLFGSSATGLTLPDGDLDISVSTKLAQSSQEIKSNMFKLSTRLRRAGIATSGIQVNHFARIPVLKFTTIPKLGSFNVDVGINNSDGLLTRDIVNDYLAKMPALRPLVLVIKRFLAQRDLNDAGKSGLGSYATTLMCISFLQLNPFNRPPAFLENSAESRSLGYLLSDFMHYYGLVFPYTESYISVSEGLILPKESADWINVTGKTRLVIQCPLNPDNDVSKSLNKAHMEGLIKAFKTAYAYILQLTPGDGNLLFHICHIDNQSLQRRQHIDTLVQREVIPRQPPNIPVVGYQPPSSQRKERSPSPLRSNDAHQQKPRANNKPPSLLSRMQLHPNTHAGPSMPRTDSPTHPAPTPSQVPHTNNPAAPPNVPSAHTSLRKREKAKADRNMFSTRSETVIENSNGGGLRNKSLIERIQHFVDVREDERTRIVARVNSLSAVGETVQRPDDGRESHPGRRRPINIANIVQSAVDRNEKRS